MLENPPFFVYSAQETRDGTLLVVTNQLFACVHLVVGADRAARISRQAKTSPVHGLRRGKATSSFKESNTENSNHPSRRGQVAATVSASRPQQQSTRAISEA